MQEIFEQTKQKYIQLKSASSFDKLYAKCSESNALIEICGASVRRGLPPTSVDFIYKAVMMPSIGLTLDNVKSTMAALIMLQIWNERVNSVYHFCSETTIETMARRIVAESIRLH